MSKKSEYDKLWRIKNKIKVAASEKSYYHSNKSRILSIKAKYESERRRTDINFRLKKNLRSRLANAIKNNHKSGSAIKNLGCSISELKIYLEFKFTDGMTWDNWGMGEGRWQIDHIKPLFKFDLSNSDQLKEVCYYTNLQPIWHKDHITKTVNDSNTSI